jgi:serine/threonine-protein kinase
MISRIARISSLILALAVVSGASAYLTLTLLIRQEETVVVPDLIGKDVVYVLQSLTDLGLNTKVGGAEYSPAIPANHVIFQDPKPGDEIKIDRDIRIVISRGPQSVPMPNLKGVSISQAGIILAEKGLAAGSHSNTFSLSTRKDEIIAHTPLPGQMISRGSRVDLLVSSGPRPREYKMPELYGRSLGETLLLFESMKLRLGTVEPVSRANLPLDSVVSQTPPSGHPVTEGYRVEVAVNRRFPEAGSESVDLSGAFLFRYRTADGFLKRRIRLLFSGFGGTADLFDGFLEPGGEIWHLIPQSTHASFLLYEDEQPVFSASSAEWERTFEIVPRSTFHVQGTEE